MAEETRRELRRRLEKRAIEENWPAKDHDILEGSFKDAGNIWIHLHKLSKDEKNELSFWRICDCNKQHGKEEPQNLEKKTSLSEAFAGITWADGKIKALAKYYFMVQCDVPFPINKTFVSDVVAVRRISRELRVVLTRRRSHARHQHPLTARSRRAPERRQRRSGDYSHLSRMQTIQRR